MNISGQTEYLAISTPIASVSQELTVPVTMYAGLPTEATEGDLLYVSDKQANYIYTGPSGWLEVATGTPTGNYLPLSGGTLTGPLNISSSTLTLSNGALIYLDGGGSNIWFRGNSGGTFYGSNSDGFNFMAEASKNAGVCLWGIDPPGGTGGNIMGLFSNSNGTCLQLSETPATGMGPSMIEDTATGVSYNSTLALIGSNANMLVQGLGIFLSLCPINVVQGAGPHVLISGNGGANNVQTSISFPNPNPASTGPSVLDANVLLSEGPQTVNGATTFTADTTMQVSSSPGDPILTLSNTYSTTSSNYTTLLFEVSPYNDFSGTATSGTGPMQIGVINPTTGSSSNDFCFSISQSYVNNNMFCVYPNPGVSGIPFQVTVNKTSPDNSGPFIFCTDGNVHVQDGYLTVDDTINIAGTSNQLVLGTTNTVTIDSVAPAASRTYTIPDAGSNANFIMSAGTQTIDGELVVNSGSSAPSLQIQGMPANGEVVLAQINNNTSGQQWIMDTFAISPYTANSSGTALTSTLQFGMVIPTTGSNSSSDRFYIGQSSISSWMLSVFPNPGNGAPCQVAINQKTADATSDVVFYTGGNAHVGGELKVDAGITVGNTTINGSSSVTSVTITYPGMSNCYIPTLHAQASIIAGSGTPSLDTTYTNFNISSTIGYASTTGVFSISFTTPLYSPSGAKPIINVIPIGLGKACYANINEVTVDTNNNCTGFGVQIWVPGGTTSDAFDFFVQVIC